MAHTCDPWVSMARLAAESGGSRTFVGRPESRAHSVVNRRPSQMRWKVRAHT